jgi:putative hemolysin
MSGGEILALAAGIVMVLVAAVLALAETSLTRLSKARAAALVDEERPGALVLRHLLDDRERALNPVLLLQLSCYLASAAIVGALIQPRLGPWATILVSIATLIVIYVVAVAMPKTWALQHPERAGLLTAPLVNALLLFPPLRWVTRGLIGISNVILPGKGRPGGPAISEDELLAFAQAAAQDEAIEDDEQALIASIIEFGDTVVREVMVPRPDMVSVDNRVTVAEAMETVLAHGYSRLPICGTGIDDVVGVVIAKDLMRAEHNQGASRPIRELVREPYFVPETKRVAELLPEMQARQVHLAIVIDEYGGTAGLVSLEDLIEELVGEIVDEFDHEEAMIEPLPGGDVRVKARMPVDELNELLGAGLPEGHWDTVGGLMFHLLGHVPDEGECTSADGYVLRAEKVQGRRIGRVHVGRAVECQEESSVADPEDGEAEGRENAGTSSSGPAGGAMRGRNDAPDGMRVDQ